MGPGYPLFPMGEALCPTPPTRKWSVEAKTLEIQMTEAVTAKMKTLNLNFHKKIKNIHTLEAVST